MTGHTTQVPRIVMRTLMFVGEPVYRFHPMIAPTIACVVETGSPNFVIK